LWTFLQSGFLKDNIKVLDFSPAKSINKNLSKTRSIEYISSDYAGEFSTIEHYDITDIAVKDDTFNLIICYHVLEHIEDDLKAMKELYRVLKPGGNCLIQTPFKDGETYEDFSIKDPQERLKHFGQEDHVRIYSVNGLRDRLTSCGFDVEIKKFNEDKENFYGYKEVEHILVARKD
jgi:ubiquinone/menaquinone biosynthesis C-methylase UbiE